jgi:predicted DNA-binding transcriptional regulator AlpA
VTNQLLGVTEVAALLGLTRQRVQQLTETDPDFPSPAAELARGRVWERDDIVKWAKATGREIAEKA